MEKLIIRPHLYDAHGRKASSVEGLIVGSEASHLKYDPVPRLEESIRKFALKVKPIVNSVTSSELRLKIDTGDESFRTVECGGFEYTRAYSVPNAPFRVDIGERVVLYSVNDFRWPHNITSHDGLVDALQILDEEGNVKYQSVHRHGVHFRNEEQSE